MGAGDSKLAFKKGIFRLSEEQVGRNANMAAGSVTDAAL